ncbi:MAG TPA: hypothetical protein HA257_01325 [Candidatus Methanoperedenaceae archaeon]|nr:hypothetical protein [Candidatus Methanoperedenaceae archaeon]
MGYPLMLHDTAWTVLLTMTQDSSGTSHYKKAIEILKNVGQASILRQ